MYTIHVLDLLNLLLFQKLIYRMMARYIFVPADGYTVMKSVQFLIETRL